MTTKDIKEHKLLSLATLGNNKAALKDLITASDRNPVIAPEGDQRKAISSTEMDCKSQLNKERKKMQKDKKNTTFVTTDPIVCSFPNLAKPADEQYGGRYSLSIPLPKDNKEAVEALWEVIGNAAENKWGPKDRMV